jgi:two-component system, cell cycle sensor histidine kinase and response regulator CckA
MVFPKTRVGAPATTKILIVEDEGIIAGNISSRLAKAGYEVAGIAESSEEALAKIPEVNPDLVLMDIRIKGEVDGIETAVIIRERFDIPFIFLTAHTDQQTIDRAKMTGASGFLSKPIHHTSLATTIEMAIHKHRADRVARHQRAWMATVLGTMADGMVVIDRDRRVRFLNGPAERLTGWTNDNAMDLDVALILPLADAVSGLEANEMLSPPPESQSPYPLRSGLIAGNRSGAWFPVDGEIAPSIDDGRIVGAVITFRDATARQALENQMRQDHKMQAVGRLAAGIAHDFNNLLFVILGYADEMLRSPHVRQSDLLALGEIRKAGESAANITHQLLKFSRKEPVRKQDLSINDVIRDTEELFRRLGGASVKWQLDLDPGLGLVRADLGQLKQVLINLSANARDAMPPTGGKVTIRTANVDVPRSGVFAGAKGPFVALSVADTGTGMSAETAEHLFEPFFTTREPGKGTGLGLSIVHSIVTDLGGTIHVESEPGHGATFTMYIPQAGTEVARSASSDPVPRAPAATVLLVEDQAGVRHLLREYLATSGCKVIDAESGEDAIRIANEHAGPIDLLITDVVMPGANGFEVARELSERRAQMKIIFISGYAPELANGLEGLPKGARFLPKPLLKKDLLHNVSELLGQDKRLTMRSSV